MIEAVCFVFRGGITISIRTDVFSPLVLFQLEPKRFLSVFEERVVKMEWREQTSVTCEDAFTEAQRWMEVSRSGFIYNHFQNISFDPMIGLMYRTKSIQVNWGFDGLQQPTELYVKGVSHFFYKRESLIVSASPNLDLSYSLFNYVLGNCST